MNDGEGHHGSNDAAMAQAWARLEEHFQWHAGLIDRFRAAGALTVVGMLETGTNESGDCLSAFERNALVERYCELFGRWPDKHPRVPSTTTSGTAACEGKTR
jgi:hypothetical protein